MRLILNQRRVMKMTKSKEPAKYRIIGIEPLTHDTKAFKFELDDDYALEFMPGDHVMIHADIDGQLHKRPYTPSSTPDDAGFFEIIIKLYPNGLLSNYIHSQYVGDEIFIQGPTPGGHFENGMAKKIGMVAGGAGVTPYISIIRTALRRAWKVDMTLLFANKSIDDIILRDEIDGYAAKHSNFKVVYSLDEAPEDWNGHVGHIDDNLLKQHLPEPADDTLIFLCGPPMMEFQLRKAILALGYEKKRLVIP